jgi:hypothetical protein
MSITALCLLCLVLPESMISEQFEDRNGVQLHSYLNGSTSCSANLVLIVLKAKFSAYLLSMVSILSSIFQ